MLTKIESLMIEPLNEGLYEKTPENENVNKLKVL